MNHSTEPSEVCIATSQALLAECPKCGTTTLRAIGEMLALCECCLFGLALEEPRPFIVADTALAEELPAVCGEAGPYTLIEEIGRGGMGIIYKARKHGSGEAIALKVLLPTHHDGTEALTRFTRETRAVAALAHPFVMPIRDICLEGEVPFFTMDLAVGGTLADLLPKYRGRWRQAAELMVKITQAVQHAHEHGILHRDLKPGNVLFTAELEPLVSDFGLAKWLDGSTEDLTSSLVMFGTPSYVAPEQASGRNKELTPATDIYSLGSIFFELLTGRPPFIGDNPLQVLQQSLTDAPPNPRTLLPTVPRDLEAICLRCLEKEPLRRYPSAEALSEDLDHWLSGRPVSVCRGRNAARSKSGLVTMTLIIAAVVSAVLVHRIMPTKLSALPRSSLAHSSQSVVGADVALVSAQFLDEDAFVAPVTQRFKEAVARTFGEGALPTIIPPPAISDHPSPGGSPNALLDSTSKADVGVIIRESFRVAGGSLRVISRIVQVNTGITIYGQTDLLPVGGSIEDFVVILTKLRTAFTTRSSTAPSRMAPLQVNVEAQRFYRRAEEFYVRRTQKDNETAIALYRRALQVEPTYAEAWAGIARAYDTMFRCFGEEDRSLQLAMAAAHRALEIDSYSAEAHAALGSCLFSQSRYAEAREEFLRALEIDSRSAGSNAYVGICLREMGQPIKALPWVTRALQFDPDHGVFYGIAAETYMLLGDDLLADQAFQRYLELIPDPVAETGPIVLRLWQKRYAEAKRMIVNVSSQFPEERFVKELAAEVAFFSGDRDDALTRYRELASRKTYAKEWVCFGAINPLSGMACILQSRGENDQAQRELAEARVIDEQILVEHPNNPRILHDLAALECLQGHREHALELLTAAISVGWVEHRSTMIDPRFEAIRGDARFKQLIAQTFPR